jgi:F-type H+-transporting ATPase subunit b
MDVQSAALIGAGVAVLTGLGAGFGIGLATGKTSEAIAQAARGFRQDTGSLPPRHRPSRGDRHLRPRRRPPPHLQIRRSGSKAPESKVVLNFTVTFFITIVNFLVLFLVLRKLLFKPVTKFMDARAKKIKDALSDAAIMKGQAEELQSRYDSLMSNADAEAERLVKEGEERAKDEAKALLEKAQAEASETRRRGEEAAEREREKARQELLGDIAALAAEVAGKLVGREAKAEDARAAESLVRELEAARAR